MGWPAKEKGMAEGTLAGAYAKDTYLAVLFSFQSMSRA
jgi:hypothetical protein